jgi:hypothetical protein
MIASISLLFKFSIFTTSIKLHNTKLFNIISIHFIYSNNFIKVFKLKMI